MNVATEPVQLGDRDRAFAMLGLSQCRSQLRAAFKRVGTFAGLDLDELTGQLEALRLGEPGNGLTLGFQSEARAALARPSGRPSRVQGAGANQTYVRSPMGNRLAMANAARSFVSKAIF